MKNVEQIKTILFEEVVKEWTTQGHPLTGDAVKSIRFVIDQNTVSMFMNKYAVIQSEGVTASKIPFTGKGGGGTSAYIEGLIRYVKLRMGKSGKEGVGIAFAIAHKHKEVGMQIRTRGRGTRWLEAADETITKRLDEETNILFKQLIKEKVDEIEV